MSKNNKHKVRMILDVSSWKASTLASRYGCEINEARRLKRDGEGGVPESCAAALVADGLAERIEKQVDDVVVSRKATTSKEVSENVSDSESADRT